MISIQWIRNESHTAWFYYYLFSLFSISFFFLLKKKKTHFAHAHWNLRKTCIYKYCALCVAYVYVLLTNEVNWRDTDDQNLAHTCIYAMSIRNEKLTKKKNIWLCSSTILEIFRLNSCYMRLVLVHINQISDDPNILVVHSRFYRFNFRLYWTTIFFFNFVTKDNDMKNKVNWTLKIKFDWEFKKIFNNICMQMLDTDPNYFTATDVSRIIWAHR